MMTELSAITIQGPDCDKFLQGQLTCDMREVSKKPLLAAHCNPQGRIISLFWICRYEQGVCLTLPSDLRTIALSTLQKYAVFFKTTLENKDKLSDLPAICCLSRAEKIAKGYPSIYAATSERFLPHPLGLPQWGGVSFNKGCYTGQEIIARTEHRGKVKQHLYPARVKTLFAAGNTLENGAIIVDCARINDEFHALVLMKDERATQLAQIDGKLDFLK